MDKLYHFSVNFLTMILVTIIVGWDCGLFLCIGLSVGKEYGDSKAVGNRWDWYDILADVGGIIIGFLFCYLIGVI